MKEDNLAEVNVDKKDDDKNDEVKKGRKIKKFSFYMNGKRVSQKNTVYQLLKNPIQFVCKLCY